MPENESLQQSHKPAVETSPPRDAWEKANILAKLISVLLIPVVIAALPSIIDSYVRDKELDRIVLRAAFKVLEVDPLTTTNANPRSWAIEIVEKYSAIKFSEGERASLLNKSVGSLSVAPTSGNPKPASRAEITEMLSRAKDVRTAEWLAVAAKEIGTKEIPGPQHNPRILEYNKASGLPFQDDETAWNSQFVNWVMVQVGKTGTRDARSRSWLNWGKDPDVGEPIVGAIVVLRRPEAPTWGGVVGFYVGEDSTDRQSIRLLGGNLYGAVDIVSAPKEHVLGYRVPSDWQGPAQ